MPGMQVKITSHRAEREGELKGKLKSGLQKAVLTVEVNAKRLITEQKAIDTGRLRGSITNRIEGSTGIVGTKVEYASYVEHGTSKMGARPYLFPAFEQVRARIMEFFK